MPNPFAAVAQEVITRSTGPGLIKGPRPIDLMPIWEQGRLPFIEWSTTKAIREGLKLDPTVYACIRRRSQAVASVPWRLGRKRRNGVIEEVSETDVKSAFLKRPNKYMAWSDLIERMVYHLDLGGNAILSKVFTGGRTKSRTLTELWPMQPDRVRPIPGDLHIEKYQYEDKNGFWKDVPTEEIVHMMYPDPGNPWWGLAPLQAVARVVDANTSALEWNKELVNNRAVGDLAIMYQQEIDDEQYEQAREMIRKQSQGASNARTPWILDSTTDIKELSHSPVEMDYTGGLKFNKVLICAVYGVPPPLIEDYEFSTLANLAESRRIFWLDTIIPLLDDFQDAFNLWLGNDFGQDGLILFYDLTNVLAVLENFNDKVAQATSFFKMGIPFNEINRRLNLGFPDIEGGDVGFLPLNIGPVQSILAPPPPPEPAAIDTTATNSDTSSKKARDLLKGSSQTEPMARLTERARSYWQRNVEATTFRLLREEASRFEATYKREGLVGLGLEAAASLTTFERTLLLAYNGLFSTVGPDNFNTWGDDGTELEFDMEDASVSTWIQSTSTKIASLIATTSRETADLVIREGMQAGKDRDQIAREIREAGEDAAPARSAAIALTESTAGAAAGVFYAGAQAELAFGVSLTKEWVSLDKGTVRESHALLSGDRKRLALPFAVDGSSGLYPADPKLPARARVNCDCLILLRRA